MIKKIGGGPVPTVRIHFGAPEEEREHGIAVAAAGGCRRYAPRPINFHNELAKGG